MIAEQPFSVDLRTDTITRPTAEMRRAMANAEVGDDVVDGDPTTIRLQSVVAEMLGKEAALFFPSGTMANLAALLLHCAPATEVLVDSEAHIAHWDLAGSSAFAGVALRQVSPLDRFMTARDVSLQLRPNDRYGMRASLLFIENTHNGRGGIITPIDEMRALRDLANNAHLPVHLDGARLWNASVASGVSLANFSSCADTVTVAFSKGLGAPIGAVLVGSAAHMQKADDIRKRLGGGMHQSGIMAAAALYGIEHHLNRLAADHEAARLFANAVDGVGGARVVAPDTNIVMIDLPRPVAENVVRAAESFGVRTTAWSPSRVRAVTHLDAPTELVVQAGLRMADVLGRELV